MEPALIIILLVSVLLPLLLIAGLLIYFQQVKTANRETQRVITDRDLLRLIDEQPDGMITARDLADRTGMKKAQASARLYTLSTFGALQTAYNQSLKTYYSLAAPLDQRPAPDLSPEPFLTVQDMLSLFRHFDFRLNPANLVNATGLPVAVLKRELKYFHKEKVVETLTSSAGYGSALARKTFVLREPYRSHPDRFLDRQEDLDLNMERILRKEDLV